MRLLGQFKFFKNTQKKAISPLLEVFVHKKIVAFVAFCSLVFVLLVGFGLICGSASLQLS